MAIYRAAKNLLFKLPPEKAHQAALFALRAYLKTHGLPSLAIADAVSVMGLQFPNRLGLAAGFDKNGDAVDALATLGFGFIEVGTITPRPQAGNAMPRLFRLPLASALINRMGFNNCGGACAVKNLVKQRYRGIVGVNIGKNAETPLANAADDYVSCLTTLYESGDFFTVNISSPNTAGLRDLQRDKYLATFLRRVLDKREDLAVTHNRRAPIVVKLSPDLSDDEVYAVADTLAECGVDGVIACNTTKERPPAVAGLRFATEAGGLSGKPLAARATAVIARLRERLPKGIAVIGVGGIHSAADACEKRQAGADLLQIYTGLIYQGPTLPREIIKALSG